MEREYFEGLFRYVAMAGKRVRVITPLDKERILKAQQKRQRKALRKEYEKEMNADRREWERVRGHGKPFRYVPHLRYKANESGAVETKLSPPTKAKPMGFPPQRSEVELETEARDLDDRLYPPNLE